MKSLLTYIPFILGGFSYLVYDASGNSLLSAPLLLGTLTCLIIYITVYSRFPATAITPVRKVMYKAVVPSVASASYLLSPIVGGCLTFLIIKCKQR